MILAAPLVIPFSQAVPALAGLTGMLGIAALSEKVNEYIQENPEESMKILSTIIPNVGIGQIFMSKEDKISLEDLEDMTDEEAQDLSKEQKEELMKQAGKRRDRELSIATSEKIGLSGPGKEKQDIEYEIDKRYDEGGVEQKKAPFDYTKFFRKRRADGGPIGIEVLFEEKVPAAPSQLVEESETILGYRGPGGYQGVGGYGRSRTSKGPKNSPFSSGFQGAKKTSKQIFSGGGGGPKPGTGSTGPAGGATRRITPTVSQTPNFGLKALEFAKKYNPLGLLFGTPVGAEEIDFSTLKQSQEKFEPSFPFGFNKKSNFGGNKYTGTTKGEFVDFLEQGKFGLKTDDMFDKNIDDLFEGVADNEIGTGFTDDATPTFVRTGKGLDYTGFIDVPKKDLGKEEIDLLPGGFFPTKKADGGRVGFNLGGLLTGQAKNIYDTMSAAGYFTEDEIKNAIIGAGYEIPGTTPDAPTTVQPIGYQGRSDDNPYAGQVVDQTDYSFNKKNYGPGEKLEINPAAVGMSFYDSTTGTSTPNKTVKEDKGIIGRTIDSFMGAAIPEKQLSQFTSPTTGGTLTGPAELGFMTQNIEGIPGNLTREDLRGMYDNYNKFLGRPSNFANARVKGPAGNLINLVPVIGSAARMFGPQGDKSLQSKYTVDGAGFGNTGMRDEFGLGTFDAKDGFLGLTGNTTRNYVDRMKDKLDDLEGFFGSRIDDFDINNLDPATLSKMKGINSFYTKQILAYQQRLATEKLNEQAKREQAAAEIKARQADTTRRARELNPDVYAKAEELGFIDSKTGGFKSAGTNENFSNKTGRGRTGYSEGGLASMFVEKR